MKKKIFNYSLVFILICFRSIYAQNIFSKVVNSQNGGLNGDIVISAPDSGFFVAGTANNGGLIIRFNKQGNFLWNKVTDQSVTYNDFIHNRDTTYYAVGSKHGTALDTAIIIKYNSKGGVIWSRRIRMSSYQDINAISASSTLDSGVVVCGGRLNTAVVLKLDKNGVLNWSETITRPNSGIIFYAVKQLPDSGYILSGSIGQNRFSLTRLNKTGAITWCKSYSKTFNYTNNNLYGVDVVLQNNNLLVYVFSDFNVFLAKTDLNGTLVWSKQYFVSPGSNHAKLKQTAGKGFCLTSCVVSGGSVLKIDSLANPEWVSSVKSGANPGGDAVQCLDLGYIIIDNGPVHLLRSPNSVGPEIVIAKTNSLGVGIACVNKNTPVDSTVSVTVNIENCTLNLTGIVEPVVITAQQNLLNLRDGCVDVIGGIETYSSSDNIAVFPNPSNGNVFFELKNIVSSSLSYSLYNLSGLSIKEGELNGTDAIQTIDCSKIAPSVYILKVAQNGKVISTHKLIVAP